MKNILITLILGLTLTGCSSWSDLSLVHTPDIQQGNIITPEQVAELKPGMSKRQVRFVLGTPLLRDVFHQERWDYPFTMKKRNEPMEIKRFSVYFEGDELARYEGDIMPAADLEASKDNKEIIVSVPDYKGGKGLVESGLNLIGIDLDE
ncbi:MAG: outer membrane protein assembly factor BamE [Chromatiales bacterium]|jgi:outer membrane protein assembly factor BamE